MLNKTYSYNLQRTKSIFNDICKYEFVLLKFYLIILIKTE